MGALITLEMSTI